MPTITLKNPTIQQKETSTLKTYYLIKDPNNPDEAFFAFEWTVKEGWQELVNNYQNVKELELEYFENNNYKKITSLYIPQAGEIIL